MLSIIFFLCLSITTCTYGRGGEEPEHGYLSVGNLALPTSQQPGALFSFGQNTVDQGDLLAYVFVDHLNGRHKKNTEVVPAFVYGVTEKFSLLIGIPVAAKLQENNTCSSGIEDVFIQGEYIIHEKEVLTHENTISLVGSIIFPTGSFSKEPSTTFGAPGVFLGATAVHLACDWYCFGSPGALFTMSHHGVKFGNQFFYEFGFGRNLAYATDRFIFMWMVEFDGIYSQRNKICNIINPNSGGNIFSICPSLWFSTQHFLIQGGIAFPVSQHLHGIQNKDTYFAVVNIGWKF